MSHMTGMWRIVTPKTRKQLYTTLSTDAYDPRNTDRSSLAAVSWYSQIMRGPGSRMTSYKQYDAMDADIDISRSLDIIAEEMSEKDDKTDLPFIIKWQKEDNQDVSDTTVVTVRAALRQWAQLQDLKKRIFSASRCMIKYGDCFFRKVSDTRRWTYVDPSMVVGIEIDEYANKISYHLKKSNVQSTSLSAGLGAQRNDNVEIVPASAMIHFSMSDDMGDSAPFGQSILKAIFRVYRQLTMLEDAVIIYRIVRAPERRVFYIDVGNMNQQQIKRYLESIKTEIRQKRAPGMSGSQKDLVDGQYDPTSLQEDYFFPVTASGKSSRVETLAGGTEDFGSTLLKTFTEKIFRGLRIPTSYMSGGDAAGGGGQSNDGKVGIAYIEELRFAKFISRLQDRLNEVFDQEFKVYLKVCGLKIDDEVFQIKLPDPTNFAKYRQAALDADLINTFTNIQENDVLARRFVLKRYLGLTDDEIQMNEVMVKEERGLRDNAKVSLIQQIYDPQVYKNRTQITVDSNDDLNDAGVPSSEGSGFDSGFEDRPFSEPPSFGGAEGTEAPEEPAGETGETGENPPEEAPKA